jgi:hypothetical protein
VPVQACNGIALPPYSELTTLFQMHLAAQMKAESNICKDYFLLGSDAFYSGRHVPNALYEPASSVFRVQPESEDSISFL